MKDDKITVELYEGKGKKSGKEFHAVKVNIGKWAGLCFPRSTFEWDYIKSVYEGEEDNED